MLTVYDPDVSDRLSLKKCPRLRRPKSTKVIRASPWDQLVEHKAEGRHYNAGSLITTHDFSGRGAPPLKVNSTPVIGERGLRTTFGHSRTNKHPSSSMTVTNPPPAPKKGLGLYVDSRARGLRTPRPPNMETTQKTRSLCMKRIPGVSNRRDFRFGDPASTENQRFLLDQYGKPQCRAHHPFAHNLDKVTLAHDSSLSMQECRHVGDGDISNEAKDMERFSTKTGLRRKHKVTLDQAFRSPYGTDQNVDLNLPQRPCRIFDSHGILTGGK
jgi:hypothetical protein